MTIPSQYTVRTSMSLLQNTQFRGQPSLYGKFVQCCKQQSKNLSVIVKSTLPEEQIHQYKEGSQDTWPGQWKLLSFFISHSEWNKNTEKEPIYIENQYISSQGRFQVEGLKRMTSDWTIIFGLSLQRNTTWVRGGFFFPHLGHVIENGKGKYKTIISHNE